MNEGQKTGLFCVIGAVMLAVGLFVAWPAKERDETAQSAGKELFENFKDPLAAASLKIVTFDEAQGKVDTFEVRRDRETGVWSIPSRKGYPADAVEQMKNAANALVGLQILDVQTRNAEDHEALGVVEPKLESLEVGDFGVGKLVSFRDETQKDLASLIIGNPVKGEEGRWYVRKPGQDPVYVVQLNQAALSTKFQDWIEDDLLQLSSIDIKSMRIEDYAATVSSRGFAIDRNYTAEVAVEGSDWRLEKMLEYPSDDPGAPPVEAKVDPTQVVNKEKLNDMTNALDDLKIVDVVRKPEGMSANLRADKSLVSDNEAVQSLVERGFLPVQAGVDGPVEIYSANGELDVTLNNGVEYILRFGNVSGLADQGTEDDQEETSSTAVNRYLLVTARVDEEQFPAPDLKPVPQTIAELEAMLAEKQPQPEATQAEEKPQAPADSEKAGEKESAMQAPPASGEADKAQADKAQADDAKQTKPQENDKMEADKPADDKPAEDKPAEDKPADEKPAEDKPADEKSSEDTPADDKPADEKPASEEPTVQEVEVEGSGEATGQGQGQDDQPESTEADAEPTAEKPAGLQFSELTDEEKQERLEAEQEKILKENTRMLDERKDRLNAAKRKVSDLNARFADWYYVIPESTYRELRIDREELMTAPQAEDAPAGPQFPGAADSPIQIPGLNAPN